MRRSREKLAVGLVVFGKDEMDEMDGCHDEEDRGGKATATDRRQQATGNSGRATPLGKASEFQNLMDDISS